MLVDTSVWMDHFRRGDSRLGELLQRGEVECHPYIIGELACGNLRPRAEILALLQDLPSLATVDHEEALAFVDSHNLAGSGLGWIDIHLLAAARLSGAAIWTHDRRLAAAAKRVGAAP